MNRTTIAVILGSSLALQTILPTIAFAQAQSTTVTMVTTKAVVPERTEIQVELQEDLKSGESKVGEEVPFTVANDVFSPQHVLLIPAGTQAFGKVTQSSGRGMFGRAGKLEFTCDYISMPDATHVPLRSDPIGAHGHGNGGAVIATALFLSVFAVFINGRDITVSKGHIFPMYVNNDTPVVTTSYVNPGTPVPTPAVQPVAPVAVAPAVVVPVAAPPAPAIPAAPNATGKAVITMNSGAQETCTVLSFDGTTYHIQREDGSTTSIPASIIQSVTPIK